MPTDAPKVFVCSTVYDFRDLRSALGEWLEEFGYQVLVSERADFPQSPESNSYKSCLDAIDKADYFLLFIGNRVGGWYDKANRISITRAEYQHAHERFKQGRLKMLAFVRQEVWDVKDDRAALEQFLNTGDAIQAELSAEDKTKIVHHPSKFVTHGQAIFEFIDEVRKAAEMKVAGPGAGPSGNWVYPFTSFKDVVDACKTVLNLSGNLRRKAMIASLRYEIEENVGALLTDDEGKLYPFYRWAKAAGDSFKGGWNDSSEYTGASLIWLGMFLANGSNIGKFLRTSAIEEAIRSGEFLEFDKTSGRHQTSKMHTALCSVNSDIANMRRWELKTFFDLGMKLLQTKEYSAHLKGRFTVPNYTVALGVDAYRAFDNVVNHLTAIYQALQGNGIPLNNLRPISASAIPNASEKVSLSVNYDKAVRWLKSLDQSGPGTEDPKNSS